MAMEPAVFWKSREASLLFTSYKPHFSVSCAENVHIHFSVPCSKII